MAIDTLGANALASNSVTTAKIAADAVTSAKIPAGAVVVGDIADGSITTDKLAADAVTAAKLADNAVVTANVASGIDLSSKGLVLPAGIALQTLSVHKPTSVSYSAGTHKVMEIALTTKKANSKIKIDLHWNDCKPNTNNRDSHNRSYGFGYKTGSASGTVGNYAGRGGRVGGASNHEGVGTTGSHADGNSPLEQSDVISGLGTDGSGPAGTWGSDYEVNQHSFCFEFSPAVAAGTVLQLAFWLKCDNSMVMSGCHYYLNGSNAYNGATSSMHATEISV